MKRTALLQHLMSNGCSLVREGSRHAWWKNDESGKRTAVPRHSEVPDQLARKICKDLGIPIIGR
ncbi:MAG: type II toxin-antitoxin system HicA family toxin [Spirochaetaceae bacterium]|nr:MAG: type II toxin-antitoxin system HicA family toxin [Spirochaetaceae bacterium]